MKISEEAKRALELTEEQMILFSTPFSSMTKEGMKMAFDLADRIEFFETTKADAEKERALEAKSNG